MMREMKTVLYLFVILSLLYLLMIMPGMRRHPFLQAFAGRMIAHRGLYDNASEAPENSLRAFSLAVQEDCGIELDVQLSKDDQVVVFHDDSCARILRDQNGEPVQGRISSYTYQELQAFHLLESEEKIPLFADVLKLIGGKVPLITEIKAETDLPYEKTCRLTDELLQAYTGIYCVESFNPFAVYWYRKNRPQIMRGQLSSAFWAENAKQRKPLYYALGYLLFNFLTKPDFIAYDCRYRKNMSRCICRRLFGNTAVAYTVKSSEEQKEVCRDFDVLIFDSYHPEGTYFRP